MIERLLQWFRDGDPYDECPKCGGVIEYVELEWNMGRYTWACFECDWIDA